MTRDEIIRMAREADMIDFSDDDSDPHVAQFIDFLASVIGKAIAAEREECAKICDRQYMRARTSPGAVRANSCAKAIRARGEKGQS